MKAMPLFKLTRAAVHTGLALLSIGAGFFLFFFGVSKKSSTADYSLEQHPTIDFSGFAHADAPTGDDGGDGGDGDDDDDGC
jgi:hypothetical protein